MSILERLRDEGYPMFSFGASFGVKVCDSPNAAPDVEEGLDELRSVGIFGTGNFQFKNKFRPTNLPIYLCQPDEPTRTSGMRSSFNRRAAGRRCRAAPREARAAARRRSACRRSGTCRTFRRRSAGAH